MTKRTTPQKTTARTKAETAAENKGSGNNKGEAAEIDIDENATGIETDDYDADSVELEDEGDIIDIETDSDEDIDADLDSDLDDNFSEGLAEGFDDDDDTKEALPALKLTSSPARSTSHDALSMYLKEISRYPMLKPDEEFSLAKRVQEAGDSDAAFRLVSSHLRLVVKIAMDFQRRWMQNVLDLIQEGNVGLMRAVQKFDPEKGIKFSYYASFWIKAYILKFIMDNWRLVKIGTTQAQRKLFYNLNKERQRLIAQGFDPDAAMLSKQLNVSEEQIIEMEQRLDSSDMSLDITVGDEGGSATRMDFLPALGPGVEEALSDRQIAGMLKEHIKTIEHKLNEKELAILHERLLSEDPITLREIGERYDITRERVRQIEARLLQKLRDHLFKEIKDFSQDWLNK